MSKRTRSDSLGLEVDAKRPCPSLTLDKLFSELLEHVQCTLSLFDRLMLAMTSKAFLERSSIFPIRKFPTVDYQNIKSVIKFQKVKSKHIWVHAVKSKAPYSIYTYFLERRYPFESLDSFVQFKILTKMAKYGSSFIHTCLEKTHDCILENVVSSAIRHGNLAFLRQIPFVSYTSKHLQLATKFQHIPIIFHISPFIRLSEEDGRLHFWHATKNGNPHVMQRMFERYNVDLTDLDIVPICCVLARSGKVPGITWFFNSHFLPLVHRNGNRMPVMGTEEVVVNAIKSGSIEMVRWVHQQGAFVLNRDLIRKALTMLDSPEMAQWFSERGLVTLPLLTK